ncbi:alanine racemase [Lentibacillus halophilus]|uniref:Alanine racemase n=1 Tax=Lentibacillus halophilus TaxID=295065 RepID=A0ABP3IXG1_9BACI
MANHIYRDTWAEVDLTAIEHNVKQMKGKLPDDSSIIAVVKADGYGHGAVQVAEKALKSGAQMLAVAMLEEALSLRDSGLTAPVIVLGWVSPEDVPIAAERDIILTFFQQEWLQEVKSYSLPAPVKAHMKWDTGMGRIGIRTTEELTGILNELNDTNRVMMTGVYTHFATADEADQTYLEKQWLRFKHMLDAFRSQWNAPVAIHIGNSAASIRFPEQMYDYIRFGISMYGLYPSVVTKNEWDIELKPAFSLHSRLIHVKKLDPGESISYGAVYTTTDSEWIGTIPIGYADGWIRQLQGSDVLIDGKRMPVVGKICMDQTMIRLDKEYPIGTKVTLIGKQGDKEIETDEIAAHLETINYEIPCTITSRVPRIYKDNN